MKKFVTLISSLLLLAMALHAQQTTKLVGMGTLGGGSIFAINEDGTNPEKWVDFTNGRAPNGDLLYYNGKLWGMTSSGGPSDTGIIFNMDEDGTNYYELYQFDRTNGGVPLGSLIESNGKLWGMTSQGGSNNDGVIFYLDAEGTNYTKVYDFKLASGSRPTGSLVYSNGRLWGITPSGGSNGGGIIFRLNVDGNNYIKVHDFESPNGHRPRGNLIESNGKLWGMTSRGGSSDIGVIFSLNQDGSNYNKVYDFDSINGAAPLGSLMESNGKLWGMTKYTQKLGNTFDGAGVIFNLDLDGSNYTKIYEFDSSSGGKPEGDLVESNGKLWGMTSAGGSNNSGVIFSLELNGTDFTKVYEFNKIDGHSPKGSLVENKGRIWGMANKGGVGNTGVVFSLDLNSSNYLLAHDFYGGEGKLPGTNLTQSSGKLWGLTNKGGSDGYGTLFNLELDGTGYSKVHDFDSTNGRWSDSIFPQSRSNLMESNAKLWGMTSHGGLNDEGVIFNLNLDGTNFTKVHDFDSAMGRYPHGGLIEANNKLWGMTSSGGSSNAGVIFSLDKNGTNYNKVYDFDGINGADPRGSLVESQGKLWGMTLFGGVSGGPFQYQGGVIFNIDLFGNNFTKVHDFIDGFGQYPFGNLIVASGKLWGMTLFGPTDWDIVNDGVIFNIALDGSGYTEVHHFNGTDGSWPFGSLVESNGKLWGVTSQGGENDSGVIFSIDSTGINYTKVYDFGPDAIAGNPEGTLLALTITGLEDSKQLVKDEIPLQLYPNPVDISFKLSDMGFKTQQVEIYNLNGRLVKLFKTNQVEYDVSNLTPGIYMIVIESPHTISYQKMVKK